MRNQTAADASARRGTALKALLDWGRDHRRRFPWRGEKDPFRLLVAEVLLQRSRSTSVAPVFTALIGKWPDAASLSLASVAELEGLLHPLGLTKRATTLIQLASACIQLRATLGKDFNFASLPGVGPATATSVAASLGFAQVPIDSVSKRVYERALNLAGSRLDKMLADLCLTHTIPTDELNWAALDLAAAICLPKRPRCEECPLARVCHYGVARAR